MNRILITGIAALAVPALAQAEPMAYNLDTNHSRVWFDVDHQGFTAIRGMFRDFNGQFMFDDEDLSASSVDVSIDAASIDMFHDGLNNHLKTDDFFGVETNPAITFTSTSVESLGGDRLRVTGDFTMLGQTQPVVLEAVHNLTGPVRGGATKIGFSASGTLDRTDFGMNFGAPNIGAEVSFNIEIEATRGGGMGN